MPAPPLIAAGHDAPLERPASESSWRHGLQGWRAAAGIVRTCGTRALLSWTANENICAREMQWSPGSGLCAAWFDLG